MLHLSKFVAYLLIAESADRGWLTRKILISRVPIFKLFKLEFILELASEDYNKFAVL